jgi:hypothetical protein
MPCLKNNCGMTLSGSSPNSRAGLMKCALDGVAEHETRIEGRGEVTSRGVVHHAVYSDGRIGELCRRAGMRLLWRGHGAGHL